MWLMIIWKFIISNPGPKVKTHPAQKWNIVLFCVLQWHYGGFINLFIHHICIDHLLCSKQKRYNSDKLSRFSVYYQGVYSSVNKTFSSINRTRINQLHVLVMSLKESKGNPKKQFQEIPGLDSGSGCSLLQWC